MRGLTGKAGCRRIKNGEVPLKGKGGNDVADNTLAEQDQYSCSGSTGITEAYLY
jgi:hypothetical protein